MSDTRIEQWPRIARLIAVLRHPDDRGIGDTVARHGWRFDAKSFSQVYLLVTGIEMHGVDFIERMNREYSYP